MVVAKKCEMVLTFIYMDCVRFLYIVIVYVDPLSACHGILVRIYGMVGVLGLDILVDCLCKTDLHVVANFSEEVHVAVK